MPFFNSVHGATYINAQKYQITSPDINPPSAINVLSTDLSSIVISFTPPVTSATISGYNAYIDGKLTNSYGTASSLTINGLSSSTTYSLNIVAVLSTGGYSKLSNASTIVTATTQSSSPPTGLTFISSTTSSITISFTAPLGSITGYNVYVNGILGTGSGTPTSYTITGLNDATLYTLTLTKLTGAVESSQSGALIASTTVNPPTGLTFISANTSSVTLRFTPPANGIITGYNSNYGTGTGTSTSYVINGLTSNTSYPLTLSSITSNGSSSPSSPLSVLTIPDAPTNVGYTSLTDNSVSITFTPVSGDGSVTYYTTPEVGSSSTSPIYLTGLNAGESYAIYVYAVNSSGQSAASDSRAFFYAALPG